MTSIYIYRVYNVWLYDIYIGVLHYKIIICWLRQLWIRNYIQSLDYTYLCPWGNHEKKSGALKFGPYRLKGAGSHQHQAKSSVTQTYTVDLERADCFGRINFRVVDTKPNPGETPIFRSNLVPSVADSFRKCIGTNLQPWTWNLVKREKIHEWSWKGHDGSECFPALWHDFAIILQFESWEVQLWRS